MKLYEIIPGKLYQRGAFPASQKNIEELRANDIKFILNVRTKADPLGSIPEITYMHIPLADGVKVPGLAKYASEIVMNHILYGEKCLVYCNAGRNRSSLVNALVLMRYGYTGKQALEHLRTVRPGAFGSNENFAAYLESL